MTLHICLECSGLPIFTVTMTIYMYIILKLHTPVSPYLQNSKYHTPNINVLVMYGFFILIIMSAVALAGDYLSSFSPILTSEILTSEFSNIYL